MIKLQTSKQLINWMVLLHTISIQKYIILTKSVPRDDPRSAHPNTFRFLLLGYFNPKYLTIG